jgi:hypothetical protein
MNIFPIKKKDFKLIGNQPETISRLERRTKNSQRLTSQYTDKSFIGNVDGNKFKIISSSIGKGAFCVMKGEINSKNGHVKVEIHYFF